MYLSPLLWDSNGQESSKNTGVADRVIGDIGSNVIIGATYIELVCLQHIGILMFLLFYAAEAALATVYSRPMQSPKEREKAFMENVSRALVTCFVCMMCSERFWLF